MGLSDRRCQNRSVRGELPGPRWRDQDRTAGVPRSWSAMLSVALLFLLSSLAACYGGHMFTYRLSDTGMQEALRALARNNPGEFANEHTFLIVVDGSACTKTLQETPHWKDWQRWSLDAGWGFALATSRADSADLVFTAALDSVTAPVLVFPGCEDYIRELRVPVGVLPMKMALDRSGEIEHFWNPVGDSVSLRLLSHKIDSVISSYRP